MSLRSLTSDRIIVPGRVPRVNRASLLSPFLPIPGAPVLSPGERKKENDFEEAKNALKTRGAPARRGAARFSPRELRNRIARLKTTRWRRTGN